MKNTTMNTGAASLSDEQIRWIENDQAKMPEVTRQNLTIRTVRAALIAQHGFCTAEDHCTCAREIGYRVCQPSGAASTPQADAAPSVDAIATELWKAADACGFEQFRETVSAAIAAGGAQEARDAFDAWNDSQTALEFEDAEAENHARFIFTAGYNAAALPREAPNGWQPIETAPKDGRMFLGWVDAVRYGESDEGVQFEVNVSEQDFCRWVEHHGYFENMMGQIGDAYHVTHWMPLPAAPAKSNGEQA